MKQVIINVFSTSGRITGRRYFYIKLGLLGAYFILSIILSAIFPSMSYFTRWMVIVICAYGFFCTVVKRLHDLDKSGIYALLLLVPGVNMLFLLFLLFKTGNSSTNKYGAAPYNKIFSSS